MVRQFDLRFLHEATMYPLHDHRSGKEVIVINIYTKRLPRALLTLALSVILYPQSMMAQGKWSFVISPYVLAPSINGSASLGRAGSDVSLDPGDVWKNVETGGMVRIEGQHDSGLGFALDYSFMDLGDGATSQIGEIRADYRQSTFDAVATYRLESNGSLIDVYAGLRHWNIDAEVNVLTGPSPGQISSGATWTDPIAGLRWQRRISPKWRVMMQGDVGGISTGSAFTWNLMGGLAYDRWENTSVIMMYRALGVDYETGTRGTPSFFEYDTVTQSLLAGIGFQF